MKKVYVPMAVDFIHDGHMKIIGEAKKLGHVIVGLMTDKAIAQYKRLPILTYNQRKALIENIKGVDEVVPQEVHDYIPNLRKIKPDYVVHGDDWKTGIQKKARDRVVEVLKEWNGVLVEPKYTEGISSTQIINQLLIRGVTPQTRIGILKRLFDSKPIVRVLEAHNGFTAMIAEKTKISKDERIHEFDAIWLSSLTHSLSRGKPDIGIVDFTSISDTLNNIIDSTVIPIIVDGDNGGPAEHFVFIVRSLERMGVSAIVIEDKNGLKRNSLFGTDVEQTQETVDEFCRKIKAGKDAQITEEFMIIARIESLILKKGMKDALMRARAYIDAGADAILIHSKEKEPDEILAFCKEYNALQQKVPLVAVPTTYCKITEKELVDIGIKMVIYANYLLRSAYPAMVRAAESILRDQSACEAEKICLPIKEVLQLIPEAHTTIKKHNDTQ